MVPVAELENDLDINLNLDDELVEMYGEKECRWFQIAARNQTDAIISKNPKARILVKLPTGVGKTTTSGMIFASPIVRKALHVHENEKLRILFVAHKHRLLTQAEREFAHDSSIEFIPQSIFSNIPDEVMKRGWHIVCIDESHHESCASIQYHLEKLGDYPIIGLTATPDRADGFLIKFDNIVETITRQQAVEEGWLSPTNIHSFIDVSGKDKTKLLNDMLEAYAHEMGQTMVFVKTKKEVTLITHKLKELGYTAIGLLNQSNKETDNILDSFSEGKIQFIVNCMKISEGVDVKGCDTVLLGRQVGSYALLNQIIGRASRPDSSCHVYELINPLSASNLDTTVVVGEPESHRLVWKQAGKWVQRNFDYITHKTNKQLGIANGVRIHH